MGMKLLLALRKVKPGIKIGDKMKIITIVKSIQRLENSLNGNPNYRIHTEDGTVNTRQDCMSTYGYNFNTFYNKKVEVDYSLNKKGIAYLNNIKLK